MVGVSVWCWGHFNFFKNFKIKIFAIWCIRISKHKNSMNYSCNFIEIYVRVCSLVHVVQEIAQHLSVALSNQ